MPNQMIPGGYGQRFPGPPPQQQPPQQVFQQQQQQQATAPNGMLQPPQQQPTPTSQQQSPQQQQQKAPNQLDANDIALARRQLMAANASQANPSDSTDMQL
jgi:hypothetical protein